MDQDTAHRATPRAGFGARTGAGVLDHVVLSEPGARLDGGFWAVVGEFEGAVHAWRLGSADSDAPEGAGSTWTGPDPETWTSSLGRSEYLAGVHAVRAAIREGDVYQVNLCRVLSAPMPSANRRGAAEPDAAALASVLGAGNPAPYSGWLHVPAGTTTPDGREVPPAWVVTASPELFLRIEDGQVTSGPIKGTAPTPEGLTAKDEAENVMITDMVRNDLQRVSAPGTVEVTGLLTLERHPGLVHLVSTVSGRMLSAEPDWTALLDATYPPASVSGAPKSAALRIIGELEPIARGPYCGAVGWVDVDERRAELAVGIRTFWWTADPAGGPGTLHFGTGAGITWGSDAEAEWAETELKAARLVALASS